MEKTTGIAFAPHLNIPRGTFDVSFYSEAFGARETRRFSNDDGSIHVAEFAIGEMFFHLHESMPGTSNYTPAHCGGTTSTIGIFVPDVQSFFDRAVSAGARVASPVTDYDYGMRQGELVDPFGQVWLVEQFT